MSWRPVAVAVLAALALGGCFGGDAPDEAPRPVTVRSDDGLATMEVPPASLPQGADGSQIRLQRVPDVALLDAGLDPEDWIALDAGPSGLVFNQAVEMQVQVENASSAWWALHMGEQGPELVGTTVTIDPEGPDTVTIPVDSFSRFLVPLRRVGPYGVGVFREAPGEAFIGETANFSIAFGVTNSYFRQYNEDQDAAPEGAAPAPGRSLAFSGSVQAVGGVLAPQGPIADRPAHTEVEAASPAQLRGEGTVLWERDVVDFRCQDSGRTRIQWSVDLEWTPIREVESDPMLEALVKLGGGDVRAGVVGEPVTTTLVVVSNPFTCLGPLESTEPPGNFSDPDPHGLSCPEAEYLSPEEGGRGLDVYRLDDGLCYAKGQFDDSESPPDACDEVHYHTHLVSLGGAVREDSQPCGAAVESDIKRSGRIYVSAEQYEERR